MQLVSGENLIRGQVSTLLSSVPPPLSAPSPNSLSFPKFFSKNLQWGKSAFNGKAK